MLTGKWPHVGPFPPRVARIVTGDVALQLGDSIGVYSRKGIVSALLMVRRWDRKT